MPYLVQWLILIFCGVLISFSMTYVTCQKFDIGAASLTGFIWSIPIFVVLVIFTTEIYGIKFIVKDYFSSAFSMFGEHYEFIGLVYALLLVNAVGICYMFYANSTNGVCNKSKDELAQFKLDLEKKLKEKQAKK